MSFIEVTYPHTDIAVVSLNRPERMNAMAFDVMVPLKETLESLNDNNAIRVIILTGTGAGFCSGADLEDPGYLSCFDGLTLPAIARRAMQILEDVSATMRRLRQPVIAAVNGAAIGGGFCLAMAADIRLASKSAYFRAAGINNGLTSAELGLSYLLPRAIGSSRAFEIMLSGRDVDGEEAGRIGLVSQTVDDEDLLPEAIRQAKRIAQYSGMGVEMSKQLLWGSLEAGGLDSHMRQEGNAQLFVRMTTHNFEEAIKARKDGRSPEFTDSQ